MVAHHGARRIQAQPSGDACAQAEFGIVANRRRNLRRSRRSAQHRLAIHGGATVGPEDFLFAVETGRGRARPCRAPDLNLGNIRCPALIDARGVFPHQHLAGRHADFGPRGAGALEFREPVRVPPRRRYEQGDELAARTAIPWLWPRRSRGSPGFESPARRKSLAAMSADPVAEPLSTTMVSKSTFLWRASEPSTRAIVPSVSSSPPPRRSSVYANRRRLAGAGGNPDRAFIPCYIMSLEAGHFPPYDTRWRHAAPHTTEAQSPTGGDLHELKISTRILQALKTISTISSPAVFSPRVLCASTPAARFWMKKRLPAGLQQAWDPERNPAGPRPAEVRGGGAHSGAEGRRMGDGRRQAVPLVGLALGRGPGAGDAGLLSVYTWMQRQKAPVTAQGSPAAPQRGAERAGSGAQRDRANATAGGTCCGAAGRG